MPVRAVRGSRARQVGLGGWVGACVLLQASGSFSLPLLRLHVADAFGRWIHSFFTTKLSRTPPLERLFAYKNGEREREDTVFAKAGSMDMDICTWGIIFSVTES